MKQATAPGECRIISIILVSQKTWIFSDINVEKISPTHNAELNNTGGRDAGSATAAAFLSAFVPQHIPWAHLDIAGVGGIFPSEGDPFPYLCKGMSGRPTRTILQTIYNYFH